jgi:hypothetical protein
MNDTLNIYYNVAHRTETWNHPEEPLDKVVVPLNNSIIQESVVVLNIKENKIIPLNYQLLHNIHPWKNLRSWVKVLDSNNRIYEGYLLDMDDDWIDIECKHYRRVKDYKLISTIREHKIPQVNIDLSSFDEGILQLSYQMKNFYWIPQYYMIIDKNIIKCLYLEGVVLNNTGYDIFPKEIKLISGSPYIQELCQNRDQNNEIELTKDLYKFNVESCLLSREHLFNLKTILNIQTKEIYLLDLNDKEVIYKALLFKTKDYLPFGKVTIFKEGCNGGIGELLGKSKIQEVYPDHELPIKIGIDPNFNVKFNIKKGKISIVNNYNKNVEITIRYTHNKNEIYIVEGNNSVKLKKEM